VKWFQRRRETRALESIQQHLALTTSIVEDLEDAIAAAIGNNEKEMLSRVQRVTNSEKEADSLRRKIMDEISKGELAPADRADLMDLVKRVDMVADWNRESTRILGAIPMQQVPESIQRQFVEFIKGAKGCTVLLQRCINMMMTKPEEALQAADEVEREEEKVDDIHEKARRLLGKEDLPRAGVAVLISQLFEAMEAIADTCEDACDQVRVIMVRK
jgi:predicted phosphate transport protein (TIGR00153 family)